MSSAQAQAPLPSIWEGHHIGGGVDGHAHVMRGDHRHCPRQVADNSRYQARSAYVMANAPRNPHRLPCLRVRAETVNLDRVSVEDHHIGGGVEGHA